MQERKTAPPSSKKEDIIGSETILETLKRKTPWILGSRVRKPKIKFPKIKRRRVVSRITGMETRNVIILGIVIILFILQTGVVYLIYRGTPAIGQGGNEEAIFLYPSTQEAFINESIVASILMIFSSGGYILLYKGSQHLYNRKTALQYIILGIIIILATYIALQAMITIKSGRELFVID